MNNENIEISALSYTDKDFGSIYPEMLDLAKQLTNKWDPSKSDESDPGLVLLKEAAFVADHNNYNIDKNILENFLPSATQDRSVRNITEMNGYTPRYFVSANGSVTLNWIKPDDESELEDSFTIPMFTLVVSDADETISYTQIEDITISGENRKVSGRFIEGTLQTLSVNDTSVITLENLDDNNRIYFPETMVAQNGVFIKNKNSDDYADFWERNNYLLTQPMGSRIYKIDYDSLKDLPYIEFPSDISNLIGDGLEIMYISTSGESGNVSANKLVKILSPTSFEDLSKNTRLTETITVYNPASITNGKDPETINEMYKSFKRVVGTFDTLVTCKDYSNKIYELTDSNDSPYVSNVYVTDRRTDYNKSVNVISYNLDTKTKYFKNISIKPCSLKYKGLTRTLDVSDAEKGELYTYIYENEDETLGSDLYICNGSSLLEKADTINLNDFSLLTEAMTPYDLVIYALKLFSLSDYSSITPEFALEQSFKPIDDSTRTIIKSKIEDVKCISHSYKDPKNTEIYCFKNYAPIEATITPYNKIDKTEKAEILNNIYKALSNDFNPRNIEFGEKLDPESIKSTIANADPRIKKVELYSINYNLYAMDSSGGEESVLENSGLIIELIAKNVLAGRVCLFNFDDDFNYHFGQIDGDITSSSAITTEVPIKLSKNDTVEYATEQISKEEKKVNSTGSNVSYIFNAPNLSADPQAAELRKNLIPGGWYELQNTEIAGVKYEDYLEINLLDNEGNIIPGTTKTYKSIDNTTCIVRNNLDGDLVNAKKSRPGLLEAEGDIVIWEETVNSSTAQGVQNLDYTLLENESIQILYPNYYSEYTYGMYVAYRYIGLSTDRIYANTEHTLTANEKLVIVYTQDGVSTTRIIGPNEVVNSSFNISPTNNLSSSGIKRSWTDNDGTFYENDNFRQLTSNQTISIRKQLNTKLNSTGIWCYWMINSEFDGETKKNRLFSSGETERILRNDEYFIYTNSSLNEVMILGAGTKLNLDHEARDYREWTIDNPTKTITTIAENGTASDIKWQKSIDFINNPLTITEMNIITLGEDDEIIITDWDRDLPDYIDNEFRYCNGSISYITNGTQASLPGLEKFYQIRSRLDINMSADDPQQLHGNQKITIGNKTYTAEYETVEDSERGEYLVEVPIYIQSSVPIAAIGDAIKLEDNCRFYKYKTDGIEYTTNFALPLDTTKTKLKPGVTEFNFSHEELGTYIIPVHMCGSEATVKAEILKNGEPIEIYDYNAKGPATPSSLSIDMCDNSYYICPKNPGKSELTLRLSWGDDAVTSTQSIVIEDYIIINGMNTNLKAGDITLNNILTKISTMIGNSDSPSTKPYYPYHLDNSIAMDNINFEDANAMWDVNNVANMMTIAQVDIENSKDKIIIPQSMIV